MGYEFVTQPQVFTKPISALGGIFPNTPFPYYYSSFESWTSSCPVPASIWPIPRAFRILNIPESFIVTQGGVVQSPQTYTVNRDFRTITFDAPVPANVLIAVTQIGTTVLTSTSFEALTANDIVADTALIKQNLRVGLTNPTYKLTIGGTGTVVGLDNQAIIAAKNSTGAYEQVFWPRWSDNATYLNYGSGGLYIRDNSSSNKIVVTPTGNVGINNSTPTTKLAVGGDVSINTESTTPALLITQNGVGDVFRANDSSTETTPFVITSAGRVGIGTNTPRYKLHIEDSSSGETIIHQKSTTTGAPRINQIIGRDFPYETTGYTGILSYDESNDFLQADRPYGSIRLYKDEMPDNFTYFTITSTAGTTFPIGGTSDLTRAPGNYIVTVGGLVQPITEYTISPVNPRAITFSELVSANTPIIIRQLVSPSLSANFVVPASSWTFNPIANGTIFNFPAAATLVANPTAYIVSVDGIIQTPQNYTISTSPKRITFTDTISAGFPVTVTPLPSAGPPLSAYDDARLIASFTAWITSSPIDQTEFYLGGAADMLLEEDGYYVTVGGILQEPINYRTNVNNKTIRFIDPVPATAEVMVVQTAAPIYRFNYSTRFLTNEGNSVSNETERMRITSKGAGYVNLNAGLGVKEGTNAAMGTATLNGTNAVTIANTRVTANSRIFLTIQDPNGTPGTPYVFERTSGVSFKIKSTSGTDTSTVAWHIIEPATF